MLTVHPTLLIGPYDWNPEHVPKEEFAGRIRAFWEEIGEPSCSAAVVYGDSRNHAELSYLSHFVPKLGPAIIVISRAREPVLLVSGAPNMLPAARRLSWIENLRPLSDAGKVIQQWMSGSGVSDGIGVRHRVALIAEDSMRPALHRSLVEALGPDCSLIDATPGLRTLMRHKRPTELRLIREACAILSGATKALAEAQSSGASVTDAVVGAECFAYRSGAQDVRTLFSLNGGRTLRPFEEPLAQHLEPLQAYIAVRHEGYWAEGFVALAGSEHLALKKAADALKAVAGIAKAGTQGRDLVRLAEKTMKPCGPHGITVGNVGNAIGLSLEEEPRLSARGEYALEADGVYSLRIGASDGGKHYAIVSAMLAVHEGGNELLWSAA